MKGTVLDIIGYFVIKAKEIRALLVLEKHEKTKALGSLIYEETS